MKFTNDDKKWMEQYGKRAKWLDQYEKLKASKHTHAGRINVPRKTNKKLNERVHRQRHAHRVSKPSTQAGANNAQWLELYKKLKEFKDTHGHFHVPRKTNKKLNYWINSQRKAHRNNKVSEGHRRLLKEIDFPFEPPRRGDTGANSVEGSGDTAIHSDQSSSVSKFGHAVGCESGNRGGDEELDEEREEEMQPPVIDLSRETRRSKHVAGRKRRVSYNEDSSDEVAVDPANKKAKVEGEQEGTVNHEGDAAGHTEIAIKEEDDAPPIKSEVVGSTGIFIKEEDHGAFIKKEDEAATDGDSTDTVIKEEEDACVSVKKEEEDDDEALGPNGKPIKEEDDCKHGIKDEYSIKTEG